MEYVKSTEGRSEADARSGSSGRRWFVLILLVIVLALFAMAPALLRLGPYGTELWYIAGWIASALVAGLIVLRVSAKCDGSGRKAWRCFGLACFMFMAGNLIWLGYGWVGAVLPVPSPADAFFFASSLLVMVGMFHYSLAGSPGSRIQVTNFALALCSTVAIGFLLYGPLLIGSGIGWLGAAVVFSFAALGLSAWTFGLLCFVLYVRSDRRFPFLLILVATGANAVANFFLGFDILNETYAAGTFYDVLWIAAVVFLAWAGLEHRDTSDIAADPTALPRQAPRPVEALIPALAIAAILAAGVAARWEHLRPEHIFVLPTMFGFAVLLALREYALIRAERELRHEVENSARQLAESEEELSAVLASTTDGVLSMDADWRVTYANQNAIDLFFSGRPFLGISLWNLLPDLVGSKFDSHFRKAMERQTPEKTELYYAGLGNWFEVHAHPAPEKLTIFFRDVTAQCRIEERFRYVAQASSDFIFDRDLASDMTWVNDASAWLPDYTPGAREVPRNAWVDCVHPDDGDDILMQIESAISSGEVIWEGEYRLRRRDGVYAPVHERASILRNDTGEPVRMIGNIVDLSEQKALEAQLRQSQRLDAVGQLTGGIAHDFNNLLTVILGNAEILAETLPADQPSATTARQIIIASERAADLTQHLLAFARKQPLSPGDFHANEIVEGMQMLVERSLTPAITLELELAENLGMVHVDRAMFENALLNLCVNARDAMPKGGTLRIETSAVTLTGSTAPDAPQAGEYVRVAVSDTGEGMDEDTLAQVFEPFFTTKPVGAGSGLGLSMVHGFVHQSGGQLRIQSSLGMGTTVELLLPRQVQPVNDDERPEAETAPEQAAPRGRILVVDDDDQVREYITIIVRSLGYEVETEPLATTALVRLRGGEPFDLLLSDVVMPGGVSGRQLAEMMLRERPGLPVLLVSGHAEEIAASDGQLDPRIGFLRKPFRKSELERRLVEMLAG
ncbi:hybrid sensor histidine kinase/response regulator [Salinihabitans flavidus]|uniref:hybrid sensor histidine kinase/response regulator n=1 Tax=Salinihabitans flavidus TaxID=569882 RepID=UPI000B892B16|nr:ATP-binding protein [Salinihabitans flavidus]